VTYHLSLIVNVFSTLAILEQSAQKRREPLVFRRGCRNNQNPEQGRAHAFRHKHLLTYPSGFSLNFLHFGESE